RQHRPTPCKARLSGYEAFMIPSSKVPSFLSAHILLLFGLIMVGWTQNSVPSSTNRPSLDVLPPATSTENEPKPARSIDLESLNFRRLSSLRSRDGSFHLTIAFFDQDHLLLTYEGSDLVHRRRTCPRTHDDRNVHALIVDSSTGKVMHRADWYLHDREQYLWPLASGRMLLRRGDSLIELDQDLSEKVVFEHKNLFWTGVTPNAQQILVGYVTDEEKHRDKPQTRKYELRLLDAEFLTVLGTIPLERPIPQRFTSKGYADVVLKRRWTWLVRFGAQDQPRHSITRVRSSCIPDLDTSGEGTLLIGRCTTAQDRYVISSFSPESHFLLPPPLPPTSPP